MQKPAMHRRPLGSIHSERSPQHQCLRSASISFTVRVSVSIHVRNPCKNLMMTMTLKTGEVAIC